MKFHKGDMSFFGEILTFGAKMIEILLRAASAGHSWLNQTEYV
jgi:hypothetical protein